MRLIDADALMEQPVWLCGGWAGDSYAEGYMDALDKVEETVRSAPTIYDVSWIPCEERLPEKSGFYLATINFKDASTNRCAVAMRYDEVLGFGKYEAFTVIAWRPLIEPYDGEGKDDEID